jgi:hypothetical protein
MHTETARSTVSHHMSGIKLAGIVFRSLFIILIALLTVRVASPQMETLRTLLDTPDDLVRVALGLAVCIWCLVNLFILPKDVEAYRTWIYLGVAVLPLSVLCAVVVW